MNESTDEQRARWRAALEAMLPRIESVWDEGPENEGWQSSELCAGIVAIREMIETDFGANR